jgi:hypothetical protein
MRDIVRHHGPRGSAWFPPRDCDRVRRMKDEELNAFLNLICNAGLPAGIMHMVALELQERKTGEGA